MILTNLLTDRLPVMAPARKEYFHMPCQTRTLMAGPKVTPRMWCCHCKAHFSLTEFRWVADHTVLVS